MRHSSNADDSPYAVVRVCFVSRSFSSRHFDVVAEQVKKTIIWLVSFVRCQMTDDKNTSRHINNRRGEETTHFQVESSSQWSKGDQYIVSRLSTQFKTSIANVIWWSQTVFHRMIRKRALHIWQSLLERHWVRCDVRGVSNRTSTMTSQRKRPLSSRLRQKNKRGQWSHGWSCQTQRCNGTEKINSADGRLRYTLLHATTDDPKVTVKGIIRGSHSDSGAVDGLDLISNDPSIAGSAKRRAITLLKQNMQPIEWNTEQSNDVRQQCQHWVELIWKYEALSGEELTGSSISESQCQTVNDTSVRLQAHTLLINFFNHSAHQDAKGIYQLDSNDN